MIKHLSLDLWGTLIRHNPNFKPRVVEFLKDRFNIQEDIDHIQSVVKETDAFLEMQDMSLGTHTPYENRILLLLNNLKVDLTKELRSKEAFDEFYRTYEKLLDGHHPVHYDNSTLDSLEKLRDKVKTLTLISNTGFIKGKTLVKLLKMLKLGDYFDTFIFSDEVGVSKPSKWIFSRWMGPGTDPYSAYLHVGDSRQADYDGAINAGVEGFLINGTTGRGLKSVITFLNGKQ